MAGSTRASSTVRRLVGRALGSAGAYRYSSQSLLTPATALVHWETVLRGIDAMRGGPLPSVAEYRTQLSDDTCAPHVTRFHVLVGAILSTQTRDAVSTAAMQRLLQDSKGFCVENAVTMDERELALLLRPVALYNNKAKWIKRVAQLLSERAAATGNAAIIDIPDTYDELLTLPGVGPKVAHLVMSCAWDTTVGICVDTHVHRVANRLGWVESWKETKPAARDAEKTRRQLERWLPRDLWLPINVTLVAFGQTVCLARRPKCGECRVRHLCPSASPPAESIGDCPVYP